MKIWTLLAGIALLTECQLFAQTANPTPSFEVASIKVREGAPQWKFAISGTRLTIESYTLFGLVKEAYNLQNYQAQRTGGPPLWLSNDILYDVTAKAEGDTPPTRDEFRQMLQSLLADRFKLRFHREMREIPVYELVVDKNGPALKPGTGDDECASLAGPVQPEDRNYRYRLINCTLAPLVTSLSADRPILDKTGLTGRYDITMFATPDFKMRDSSDRGDISVLDAVRKLGLRMEAKKDNIEVIVVDHVEKPSEN